MSLPPQSSSFDHEPEPLKLTCYQLDRSEPNQSDTDLEATINFALAHRGAGRGLEASEILARGRGMTEIARTTGLSRESLYRLLARQR